MKPKSFSRVLEWSSKLAWNLAWDTEQADASLDEPSTLAEFPALRRLLCGGSDSVSGDSVSGVSDSISEDQRGVYAPFVAIIATALLFLGGFAYDGPRIIVARQQTLHAAQEAARAAVAVISAGGTASQAETAVRNQLTRLVDLNQYQSVKLVSIHDVAFDLNPGDPGYEPAIILASFTCVGSRVEVSVLSGYAYRSVMKFARDIQPIEAIASAEASLLPPGRQQGSSLYIPSGCHTSAP